MNIFAAVFDKKVLDPLLAVLDDKQKARLFARRSTSIKPGFGSVKFWGTQGTADYLKGKGFSATSVVAGFDFNGRVKSLDKKVFATILADKSKKSHLNELKNLGVEPIDVVIVDLYKPMKKGFPESMDIGGQALIRAAIKNYKHVALAFDKKSIKDLAEALKSGTTSLEFRKMQAKKAATFITDRGNLEANLL